MVLKDNFDMRLYRIAQGDTDYTAANWMIVLLRTLSGIKTSVKRCGALRYAEFEFQSFVGFPFQPLRFGQSYAGRPEWFQIVV